MAVAACLTADYTDHADRIAGSPLHPRYPRNPRFTSPASMARRMRPSNRA
jgi:hypothetical protein